MDCHYYTTGELSIRAQKEADGFYHLYCHQLGSLDTYRPFTTPRIKRFRSFKVGREMVKGFLKVYLGEIQKEVEELDINRNQPKTTHT